MNSLTPEQATRLREAQERERTEDRGILAMLLRPFRRLRRVQRYIRLLEKREDVLRRLRASEDALDNRIEALWLVMDADERGAADAATNILRLGAAKAPTAGSTMTRNVISRL